MKSCMVEITFWEDGRHNCSVEINTLDGCRIKPTGSLWPVELQLLDEIVKLLRDRKDVFQAKILPRTAEDVEGK